MAHVRIPTPLRQFTQGKDEIEIQGETLAHVLKNLDQEYRGIGEKIVDEKGSVRRFINIFIGEHDVRHLEGLKTRVQDDDVISIFPAIAGGRNPTVENCRILGGRIPCPPFTIS